MDAVAAQQHHHSIAQHWVPNDLLRMATYNNTEEILLQHCILEA